MIVDIWFRDVAFRGWRWWLWIRTEPSLARSQHGTYYDDDDDGIIRLFSLGGTTAAVRLSSTNDRQEAFGASSDIESRRDSMQQKKRPLSVGRGTRGKVYPDRNFAINQALYLVFFYISVCQHFAWSGFLRFTFAHM